MLYGGGITDNLAELRYQKFQIMVASCKSLDPHRLPPTSRAAYFHALRVHLQIVKWDKLDEKALDPLKFGWDCLQGELSPITTDSDAAPAHIIAFIRCK